MNQPDIISAARELVPLIRELRADGERQAHLSADVVKACGQAGLFRMTAPKEVGGLELAPSAIVAATEIVSSADPAVGWYINNSMPVCTASAWLGERDRARVFAEPDANFGFGGMPTGQAVAQDGGYRLNGRWPVVTGVEDAHWVGLEAVVMDGDTPREVDGQVDVRLFLVPTSDLHITDTWKNVAAMRGTGSNAVSVTDIDVPDALAWNGTGPRAIERPYFDVPVTMLQFAADAATVTGVLETALESVVATLSVHQAAFTGEARRDQAATQELVIDATARLRAVRAGLLEVACAIDHDMHNGRVPAAKLRADLYASVFLVFETGRDLASRLYAGGTREAFMRDHPLEQSLRDLHAIAYVMAAARFVGHSAGRVLLGGDHDPGL